MQAERRLLAEDGRRKRRGTCRPVGVCSNAVLGAGSVPASAATGTDADLPADDASGPKCKRLPARATGRACPLAGGMTGTAGQPALGWGEGLPQAGDGQRRGQHGRTGENGTGVLLERLTDAS